MDSINTQQDEKNHEDLSGEKAILKLKELVNKASTCFFCTHLKENNFETRPMSVLKTDEAGNLWFLSATDSFKNQEIENDHQVKLLFQGDPHSDFLSLTGKAYISKDKNMIEELWNPMFKSWFTEGKDDARISVIKVVVQEGYYWDTKHALPIAFLKRIIGSVIGKTMDDSIEGNIKP